MTAEDGTTVKTYTVTINRQSVFNVLIDELGNLYKWRDSARDVKVFYNASLLTGDVVRSPDLTIRNVANSGYGMQAITY